jgi:pyridoxine/pyridoxamine 5'-phosphate oxidase
MNDSNKAKVYNFMREHRLGVLATVTSNSLPQAAVVGIAVRENMEVLFATYDESRKAHNLKMNPRVALVVGWESGKTVQYEGEAEELSRAELEAFERNEFASVPSLAKYVRENEGKYYKLKPNWIRYLDVSTEPWEKIELKFI